MKDDQRGKADGTAPKDKGRKKSAAGKKKASGSGSARAQTGAESSVPSSIETFVGEPAPAAVVAAAEDFVNAIQAMEVIEALDVIETLDVADAVEAAVEAMDAAEALDAIEDIRVLETIGLMEALEAPALVSRHASLKVGLIVGREWSFPPKFIDEVNNRDQGVIAEYAKLGAERIDDPCEYALIVDRISHEVPFYRTYLKHAVLQGTTVVNNPLMWSADDKFLGASLITKLGVASPRTAVLPNKSYVPGIVPSESLRNLKFPLDWKALVQYVGLPCVLKDAHGGGWKEVYICRSLDELIHHYDNSGLLTMIVQEFIEWDQFVRCMCIGQEDILPMKYDPRERRYLVEHEHLGAELGNRVVRDALTIVRALGYDMNSIEFAVRDGIPYAIDFMNPAPDMDLYSLTPHYFDWVVTHMADMAIRLARSPRRQAADLSWSGMLTATRSG